MKNLILIFTLSLTFISCQKEVIKPNTEISENIETINSDKLTSALAVNIAFNDVFNSGLDTIFVFKDNIQVGKVAVGCNTISLRLGDTYCFKKLDDKNVLKPLYGYETTVETYFTFNTKTGTQASNGDYTQSGLLIFAVLEDSLNLDGGVNWCEGANFTLNAWF
jgi:hypothetical protein